ncbi:RNase adapter RapZ [Fusobacterium gonidiaformans]|uniref:RNase adapter RapZ n=1 Tax=Fusobacterium gonidiaformans TaxID=849 RepID=UPI0023F06D74|nr:RNase adapter RapZ [Fusobacterium gonidiaformans]
MKKEVVIVTGLSGGGKTTVLNILEDLSYYTIDNMPIGMEKFLLYTNLDKIAIGIDIRTFQSFEDFLSVTESLQSKKISYSIIFVEASKEVILSRYHLTRRHHPLKESTLLKSIEKEIAFMSSIKEIADGVIDTSFLKPRDLEPKIKAILKVPGCSREMNIHLQSFGFKYGLPIDVDLVFDVRFLPNPYYKEELKEKSGNDPEVVDYIDSFPISAEFYKKLYDFISFLIPQYITEGKKHLSIGIGCSGGKHRSVAFVNKLYKDLVMEKKFRVYKSHREQEFGNW